MKIMFLPWYGNERGRNFSKDFPTDSLGVILNEAAVKVLGYKDPFKETIYRPNFMMAGSMEHWLITLSAW
jgi:putative ABC transport system permease protein